MGIILIWLTFTFLFIVIGNCLAFAGWIGLVDSVEFVDPATLTSLGFIA